MTMNNSNSFNISKRSIEQITSNARSTSNGRDARGGVVTSNNGVSSSNSNSNTSYRTKTRRLDVSLPSAQRRQSMIVSSSSSSSTTTRSSSFSSSSTPFVTPSFMTSSFMSSLPRRATFPGSSSLPSSMTSLSGMRNIALPVLSPTTYMTMSLKNKKITTRIDPYSIEQALYFEPYTTGEIQLDLLKALRTSNLEQLRSFLHVVAIIENDDDDDEKDKNKEKEDRDQGEQKENEIQDTNNSKIINKETTKMTIIPKELQARNQFGENLVHISCRMGIFHGILTFFVDEAKVPLNVRDKFGRTPLHNACMSAIPNFDNIYYLLKKAPKLLVFEDDKGKIPFELIPSRCYERWTRFLSEKNILKYVATELAASA